MKKIVVVISGGVLMGIYADPKMEPVEVKLHDEDNLKNEGKTGKQRDSILKKQIKGLVSIY